MTTTHRVITAWFTILMGSAAIAQQTTSSGSNAVTRGEFIVELRLKPGSAAIDRGVALPNINDGFTGKAPDHGALEAAQPLPIYGPRPLM